MGVAGNISHSVVNAPPSPYPSPPRGEGRVRRSFHGCHGKKDAYGFVKDFALK